MNISVKLLVRESSWVFQTIQVTVIALCHHKLDGKTLFLKRTHFACIAQTEKAKTDCKLSPQYLALTVVKSATRAVGGDHQLTSSVTDSTCYTTNVPGMMCPRVNSGWLLRGEVTVSCLDLMPVPHEGVHTWYLDLFKSPWLWEL